jgi:hypothetical protein
VSTNVTVISGNGSSTYDVIIGETSSTYEVISGLGSVDFEVSYGSRGPAGLDDITTNTDTTLSGYIFGNGTKIAGATLGSTSATGNTIAIRDASGNLTANAFLLPSNGFTGTVDTASLTASRAYTLPDKAGYLALTQNANGAVTNTEFYAKAAVPITAGQAVYISGASGANKIITLAQANTEATSSKTIGLALQNLATNGFGYVVSEGDVTGLTINLGSGHGVSEGDPIWLSPTTPGGLIFGLANKPSAPNNLVFLGYVTRINGNTLTEIFVKVQNGFELEELHNVAINGVADSQVLTYESSTGLWKNKYGSVTANNTSNLTGYIFGNGTNIAGATAATSSAVANTLVLRASSTGTTSFSSNSGIAISAISSSNTGVDAVSDTGTGARSESVNGAYHHLFGSTTPSNNRSAVERVRGWFVWFFSTFTGRLKTADITANRDWTLPNVSGTIAITSNSDGSIIDASTTAKGIVELATVAESQAGTDSVRAVTPDGLPMRKVGTAWIGGDLTGNTRGANALDVQSLRDSATQVANQSEGVNYGIRIINNGASSTAVGNNVTIRQTSAYSGQDPSVACSVFGVGGSAAGGFSTTIGADSEADGNGCTAIGVSAVAIGDIAGDGSSTAIGASVTATGNYNTAVGAFSSAVGPSGCTAIGTSNGAEGDLSTAIGYGNSAAGLESIAIGNGTISSNYQTISIGVYSNATGFNDIAFGYSTNASGGLSLAIGNGCESRSDSSIAIGGGSYVYNNNTLRLNSGGSSPSYIRLHGNTGMCAMTVQNRSTEYDDAKRSQSVTITRSGTTATVTLNAHGYSVGALVIIAGASQAAYNGTKTILSVATNSFTYEVTGSPATPATGTITAVAGDGVERDNTLARGEFAIRRNGLQFILDYNDAGTVKNIILGTAT